MDLREEIAWLGNLLHFGDILDMDGPLVEIGSSPVFDNSAVGGWQYSQRGTVRARPGPAGPGACLGIVASGEWRVASGRWRVANKGRTAAREEWPVVSGQ